MAAPKKKIKKIVVKEVKETTQSNFYSFDNINMNYNSSWLSETIWSVPIKVVFNILLILEIAQIQLVLVNGLSTTESMQCSIHRHQSKILSLPEIMKIFVAVAVETTSVFAQTIRNAEIADRFKEISTLNFTSNARFKGIVPVVGMNSELLKKFTAGKVMSLRSTFQTQPIYHADKVVSFHKIEDVKAVSLNDIKKISPFPDHFEEAIKFLQKKISAANPFNFNIEFQPSTLYNELGYQIESTHVPQEELVLYEEDEDMDEEELERLRQYNRMVENQNK